MIETQASTSQETLRQIAALMMNAARTAPKARGMDNPRDCDPHGRRHPPPGRQTGQNEHCSRTGIFCPGRRQSPPIRSRRADWEPVQPVGTQLRLVRFSDLCRKNRTGSGSTLRIQHPRPGHCRGLGGIDSSRPSRRLPCTLLGRCRRSRLKSVAGLQGRTGHPAQLYREKPLFRPQAPINSPYPNPIVYPMDFLFIGFFVSIIQARPQKTPEHII